MNLDQGNFQIQEPVNDPDALINKKRPRVKIISLFMSDTFIKYIKIILFSF